MIDLKLMMCAASLKLSQWSVLCILTCKLSMLCACKLTDPLDSAIYADLKATANRCVMKSTDQEAGGSPFQSPFIGLGLKLAKA